VHAGALNFCYLNEVNCIKSGKYGWAAYTLGFQYQAGDVCGCVAYARSGEGAGYWFVRFRREDNTQTCQCMKELTVELCPITVIYRPLINASSRKTRAVVRMGGQSWVSKTVVVVMSVVVAGM